MKILPLILLALAFPAQAADLYVNKDLSSSCSNYNPAAGTCGGGGDDAVADWADVKSWAASKGTSPKVIMPVGAATEGARKDVQMFDDPYNRKTAMSLAGNECTNLTIRPDPNFPYARLTHRDPIPVTNWTRGPTAASYGRDYLPGHVYWTDLPPNWKSNYPGDRVIVSVDNDIERILQLAAEGNLREWDPLTKTRWVFWTGRRADEDNPNGGTILADRPYRGGDMWASNDGRLYYFSHDGQHPETAWTGQSRELYRMLGEHKWLRAEDCENVIIEGLYFDFHADTFNIEGVLGAYIQDNTFGRGPKLDSYYPQNISEFPNGNYSRHVVFRRNKYVMTTGDFSNHRGNPFRIRKTTYSLISENEMYFAGSHGSFAVDGARYNITLNNIIHGTGGKVQNQLGAQYSWIHGNRLSLMTDPVCTYANLPAGWPGPSDKGCDPQHQSDLIKQTETHMFLSQVCGNQLVTNNEFSSGGGGIYISARKGWGLCNGYVGEQQNRYSRSIQNVAKDMVKGPLTTSYDNRWGPDEKHRWVLGHSISDGSSSQESTKGPTYDYRGIGNVWDNLQGRGGAGADNAYFLNVTWGDWTSDKSLAGRRVTFERELFIHSDPNVIAVKVGGSNQTCAAANSSHANIDVDCESTPLPVVRAPDEDRSGSILSPVDPSHTAVDGGKTAATATNAGVSSQTLNVDDIHTLPSTNFYGADNTYGDALAEALNVYYCGEADCSDSNNPGAVPDAYYPAGGLSRGEMFVQVGSQPLKYDNHIVTDEAAYEGILTLTTPATWSQGDGVHLLPWTGAAPDQGREFYGTVDDVPKSLTALNDSFSYSESQTVAVPVCANDRGTGDAASGFEVDASSLDENSSLISAISRNAGDTCKVDVTLTSGSGIATFTYSLEHVAEGVTSNAATVSLLIVNASAEQAVHFYPSPIDILGADDTWEETTLTSQGSPADAAMVFGYAWSHSSIASRYGQRDSDSSDADTGHLDSNSGAATISATGTNGEIDSYSQDSNLLGFQAEGYIADVAGVTDGGSTLVPVTCDGTDRTIDETGDAIVLYRADGDDSGNWSIMMDPVGGTRPNLRSISSQQMIAAPVDSAGDVNYNCTGSQTNLERVVSLAGSAGVVLPSGDDFVTFSPAVAATAEWVDPQSAPGGIDCGGPCLGYVVAMMGTTTDARRFSAGPDTAPLSPKDEGAVGARFQIVEAASDGRIGIVANHVGVDFHVMAGLTVGVQSVQDPTIVELSTCPGTTDIQGRLPDITSIGTAMQASDTGVQCDAGDIDLPAGEAMIIPVGEGDFHIDGKFEETAGRTVVEFHDDLGSYYDYPTLGPVTNTQGMSIIFNWSIGRYSLFYYQPDGSTAVIQQDLPDYIASGGDAYFRIVSQPTGNPWQEQEVFLWLKPTALTDEDLPILTGVATAPLQLSTGVVEIWQKNSPAELALPLTITSPGQVDAVAPDMAVITPTTVGNVVTLDWPAISDNGASSVSYVKQIEVLRDASPSPSTVIAVLDGADTMFQDNPGTGTFYYRLRARDASGNVSTTGDTSVSTSSPNAAPTVTNPVDTLRVDVRVNLDSPVMSIDGVALCSGVDPNGDPMHVAEIKTQPAEGVATLRQPINAVFDYQHDQGASAMDSLVITIGDDQGSVSADCTVSIEPRLPPYFDVHISDPLQNAVDAGGYNFLARIGPSHDGRWDAQQERWKTIEGTLDPVTVPCERVNSGGFTCGNSRIYLDVRRDGEPIQRTPPVGAPVSVMMFPLGETRGLAQATTMEQN